MFVSFEGIEGCGKSTQIHRAEASFRGRGIPVVLTREPGGSPLGCELRGILLGDGREMAPVTELLLYCAERAEHVARVIRPALEAGAVVLTDRYGDATRAYQAFGRGLPLDEVERVHAFATGGLEPDLTLWLRLPVEDSLDRARRRHDPSGEGRFEAEALAFHRKVAEGYEALAKRDRRRIVPVDGSGSEEEVAIRIRDILKRRGAFG